MKKILVFLLAAILILALPSCSMIKTQQTAKQNNGQLAQKQKVEDFEYAYNLLKDNYPFFKVNKRLTGIDWLKNKNKYISMIKSTVNDTDFYVTMKKILEDLNNGHTHLIETKDEYYDYYNIFSQNSSDPRFKQMKNSKTVKRYNNYTTASSPQIKGNGQSQSNVRTQILQGGTTAYISIKSCLNDTSDDAKILNPFLNKIKDYKTLIIDIRGNGGGDSDYWEKYLVPMIIDKPYSATDYLAFRGGKASIDFIKYDLGNSYNELMPIKDIDKYNLKNIPQELKTDFKYFIDDHTNITPSKDSIHFKGKIYLLVDNGVYSSAEMLAAFSKASGFATIVGKETGGDGIGMTPLFFCLPNSGYILELSLTMGLTSDGSCESEYKIQPDIKIDTLKNLDLSKDAAVQKVIQLNNN